MSKRAVRSYDDATKRLAVELAIRVGLVGASDELGIPVGTIGHWRQKAGYISRARRLDLTGKRFGKLTVLRPAGSFKDRGGSRVKWECLCDCGELTIADAWKIKSGHTKSCGCLNRFPNGEAAFNHLFSNYQKGAESRGLEFSLTKEQFRALTQGNCAYCGVKPSSNFRTHAAANGTYCYNGVDRIDNHKGYTSNNSVACCKQCNRAKSNLPFDEWVDWVERLTGNFPFSRWVLEVTA